MYNFIRGIKNLIRWIPIIWDDEDWDWVYLSLIMEAKMIWMAKHFKDHNIVTDSENMSKELLICVEAMKRMRDSNLKSKYWYQQEEECQRLLGKIIGRKFRCWWD